MNQSATVISKLSLESYVLKNNLLLSSDSELCDIILSVVTRITQCSSHVAECACMYIHTKIIVQCQPAYQGMHFTHSIRQVVILTCMVQNISQSHPDV